MATEIRHCALCDHQFEVEVTSGGKGGPAEGCPDLAEDCDLGNSGDRVKIVRQID